MVTQLKLLLDPSFKDALLRHPLLLPPGAAAPGEQTVADTYFDTPDWRLHQRDVALRVRRVDGGWIQHIERNGSPHARQAWEAPVDGPAPELARLRDLVDNKQIRRDVLGATSLGKPLAPVFTAELRRTAWEVAADDGARIRCAFEQGRLASGDSQATISELALELGAGDPARLFDLALALQREFPMHIDNRSQADRGYALLAPHGSRAVKAAEPVLARDLNVGQAFQAIAWSCLSHVQDNGAGVTDQHDVESVHQMRVGLRRLGSALGLFKAMLHLPADIKNELDWLAGELGAARDWDVMSGSTLPALGKTVPDPRPVEALLEAAGAQARTRHVAAAAAVGSPRYTELMLNLARWIHARGWRTDPASQAKLDGPVMKFARKTLKRDQRRLRKRAATLRTAAPQARHRVRIAAKKARYGAEFFGSLFPSGTVRPYVKALVRLQDELGHLNDAAVAERLLDELSAAQPQLAVNVGFARGLLAARAKQEGRTVLKRWRRFDAVGRPR